MEMGRRVVDLSGHRFGKLVAVCPNGRSKYGTAMWLCKCDCGAEKTIIAGNLRSGQSGSCGCDRLLKAQESGRQRRGKSFPPLELEGQRFNRWTVLGRAADRKWRCQCDCGSIKEIHSSNLTSNKSKSCGCLQKEAAANLDWVHGMVKHPIHRSWTHMKNRCLNNNHSDYRFYGAKGVTVCDRWMDFKNFRDDMLPTWQEGLTLDRVDPTGNYEPSNCRWATWEVQYTNKRQRVRA